jgi:hypothetical protein
VHLLPKIQVPFLANAMASIIQVGTFFCISSWFKKRIFGRSDIQCGAPFAMRTTGFPYGKRDRRGRKSES